MYEYKIVRVDLTAWKREPKADYHEVIHQHAREGWRLQQIFAPPVAGHGYAAFFELIFEREVR